MSKARKLSMFSLQESKSTIEDTATVVTNFDNKDILIAQSTEYHHKRNGVDSIGDNRVILSRDELERFIGWYVEQLDSNLDLNTYFR